MKGHSFPKIFALGHRYTEGIFDDWVEITEKLDGSQFVFGKDKDGEFFARSKGAAIDDNTVQALFRPAWDHIQTVKDRIPSDIIFYSETLSKPKHNTLQYKVIPHNHIALFGVSDYDGVAMEGYEELVKWSSILDVDVVPIIHEGPCTKEELLDLIDRQSTFGDCQQEGVVIKRYREWESFGQIVGVQSAKVVNESFKEKHSNNPDFKSNKWHLDFLIDSYKTEARWDKAVQYLRESGQLEGDPKDIGAVIKRVQVDVEEECEDEIKQLLWNRFKGDIMRGVVKGVPEWYKNKLINEMK